MCLGVAVIFIFPDTAYSMDPSVLLGRIKNRRLKKSKIAKEIENS